jgi:predicted nucleic acid-binding protein
MKRALLDTNILLDVLLARSPWDTAARGIWQAHEQGKFEGYISAITLTTIFYLGRKPPRDSAFAREVVGELLNTFKVCPVDWEVLRNALSLPLTDFEDAVQVASASKLGIEAIITRDPKGFKNSPLPIFSPVDYLNQLA